MFSVLRDFDDLLGKPRPCSGRRKNADWGLANAVLLAEPQAPFLLRWLEEYRSFRGTGRRDRTWNEHSVKVPSRLANEHPDELTVLPHTAFCWPLWHADHLMWIFESNRPVSTDAAYCHHLWEAMAWNYLEDLTPASVRSSDTNFNRWAAPYVAGLPDAYGMQSLPTRLLKVIRRLPANARKIASTARRSMSRLISRVRRSLMDEQKGRRFIFQEIYRKQLWGWDNRTAFYSGVGSRGEAARVYVDRMVPLLERLGEELGRPLKIVDLGCGDFEIGRALLARLPGFDYAGCDIVPELVAFNNERFGTDRISFRELDIVSGELPEADVCLVRQVLQHLSNADIARCLARLRYEYIYVTESHPVDRTGAVNPDMASGSDVRFDWRTGRGRGVELGQPPFNLNATELFRIGNTPHEELVTEQITPGSTSGGWDR